LPLLAKRLDRHPVPAEPGHRRQHCEDEFLQDYRRPRQIKVVAIGVKRERHREKIRFTRAGKPLGPMRGKNRLTSESNLPPERLISA
jgi:hypothetical protein